MVYEYIVAGLKYAANNRTCDDLYSSVISKHMKDKDWEAESFRLVQSWCKLNVETYNIANKDTGFIHDFLTGTKIFNLRAVQLCKFVECVEYNIEQDTIINVRPLTEQEVIDLKLLITWRLDILMSIVHNLTEYDLAAYSEIPPQQQRVTTY